MDRNVTIIGTGPIGQTVAEAVGAAHGLRLSAVLYRNRPGPFPATLLCRSAGEVPDSLVADCAGGEGLTAHGAQLLAMGRSVLTLSAAALADDTLRGQLQEAAQNGGAQLGVVSGAIGAIDALAAAAAGGLTRVTYTGRKPPVGWRGSPAEAVLDLANLTAPAEHYRGSARQAALDYPKNANVAATVALAGLGFDNTEVVLIADPSVSANTHTLEAEGAFGHFSATFAGVALPGNPRSSAMAAYAMISALRGAVAPIRVG